MLRTSDTVPGGRTMSSTVGAAGIALLLFIPSCASPTNVQYVTPHLDILRVSVFDSPSGLMMSLSGFLAEGEGLATGEALSVTLVRSGTDTARVDLTPAICTSAGQEVVCRRLLVSMASLADLEAVRVFLAGLDAAFISVLPRTPGGQFIGVVHVFTGSPEGVLEQLSERSDVVIAEVVGTGSPGTQASRAVAVATVPTLQVLPALPSAHFALTSGDTIEATYIQPDGTTLTATTVVP